MKKEVIRVGDKVRVDNPQFFVRCGYPKTLEDVKQEVIEEFGQKIAEFIKKTTDLSTHLFGKDQYLFDKLYRRIVSELAHTKLIKNGLGGSERKIYTKEESDLSGKVAEIRGKRFVKTGFYNRGTWHYGSFFYEDDYEPPFLTEVKTHIILKIDFEPSDIPFGAWNGECKEIEAIHVTKLS